MRATTPGYEDGLFSGEKMLLNMMEIFDTISFVRALETIGETKGDMAKSVNKHVKFGQQFCPVLQPQGRSCNRGLELQPNIDVRVLFREQGTHPCRGVFLSGVRSLSHPPQFPLWSPPCALCLKSVHPCPTLSDSPTTLSSTLLPLCPCSTLL